MSRSFHTTRKDVRQAYKKAESGDDSRVQEYQRLQEEYLTKRRTKNHVKEERQHGRSVHGGFSIDTLPIETDVQSEYLYFPASEQDIRALLERMPQGLIDGLDKITLTLGKYEQKSPEEVFYAEPERDPYLGRLGYEVFGNIYRPACLGTYFLNLNEIKLYGYIYDPAIESRALWDLYLRLHMLQTFVHELAHHYDFTNRIARGKWRMDDVDKGEIYAETVAHDWTREYIIPYLQETYSTQCKQFDTWITQNAKVLIDLSLLAGDCRSTTKNNTIRISSLFKTSCAFEEFVQDILSGNDSVASRVGLARELHYSEEYKISLEILDVVLSENVKNIDALALYGEINEHLGNYSEAIEYAKKALRLDKTDINAHHVMCDSYAGLEQWESSLKWARKGLSVADDKLAYRLFLRDKALAESKLNMYHDAKKTILEIKELYGKRPVPKYIQKFVSEIEKEMR